MLRLLCRFTTSLQALSVDTPGRLFTFKEEFYVLCKGLFACHLNPRGSYVLNFLKGLQVYSVSTSEVVRES